jgi:hypothetical protein
LKEQCQWQTSGFGSVKPKLGQKTEKLWIYRALFSIMDESNSFIQMLTYTVFQVLFSHANGFGQKNYLSPISFGNKHN